jgi:hypothetical protein
MGRMEGWVTRGDNHDYINQGAVRIGEMRPVVQVRELRGVEKEWNSIIPMLVQRHTVEGPLHLGWALNVKAYGSVSRS